jgi:hypothetical protein
MERAMRTKSTDPPQLTVVYPTEVIVKAGNPEPLLGTIVWLNWPMRLWLQYAGISGSLYARVEDIIDDMLEWMKNRDAHRENIYLR